jgi:hypothetical protein
LSLRRDVRRVAERAGHGWLDVLDTFEVLAALGLPVAPWAVARTTVACVGAARAIGFPCVLKADVAGIVHKSDAGAVVTGIESAAAVRRSVADLRRRFGNRLNSVLVQRQVVAGPELLVGGVRDPAIGPLVVVGAGGTNAEVWRDRQVALAPITARQARHAVEDLRMFPLLNGFRGRPISPLEPIVDIIERIGLLMAAVPEVVELDLNPIIATPDGCVVVDARIAVSKPALAPLRGLRVSTSHQPSETTSNATQVPT